MNIIWIAPPAAGKGTYSSLLKEKYGFNHISAGDALREQVSLGTEIGKEVKQIIEKGEMVDDNLMKRLIEAKLKTLDLTVPFMMDGYPRKINQVHDYEEILKKLNIDVILPNNHSKENLYAFGHGPYNGVVTIESPNKVNFKVNNVKKRTIRSNKSCI